MEAARCESAGLDPAGWAGRLALGGAPQLRAATACRLQAAAAHLDGSPNVDRQSASLPYSADDSPAPGPGGQDQAVFEAAQPSIEEALRFVCRRRHCSADEAEEFASAARLHLIDGGCRVLLRHRGQSSLRTYLVVVLDRLLIDLRRKRWGVWRPSAEARRRGPVAVRLEQLLARDGVPVEQALQQLQINEGVGLAEEELRELAAGLPRRPARREENASLLDGLAVPAQVVEETMLAEEREARRRELRRCLGSQLAQLSDEDALLLRLRFGQGRSVVAIAHSFGRPAKPLYRRIEALLRRLREGLEAGGFGAREGADLIEASAWDDGREVLP